MARVLVIHASCEDLRFWRPLKRRLIAWLGRSNVEWRCLDGMESHGRAMQSLVNPQNQFVVILLHGRSDGMRGGDYPVSADDDSPSMFLKKGEMGVFGGKSVFCLSCKGNEHAGEIIAKGARVLLAFDDVPFCRFDPVTGWEVHEHSLTVHCKRLIFEATSATLSRILRSGESFEDAGRFLQLYVRQAAVRFVRQNKNEQYRNDIPRLFKKMDETVRISGNGSQTFGRKDGMA